MSDGMASRRPGIGYPEEPTSPELALELPAGKRWVLVLSHDVDHLGLREHVVDGFLLRQGWNAIRQNLTRGRFRPLRFLDQVAGLGLACVGVDRWDVIGDLLEEERRAGVPSTWFFAMRRGLGIAYRPEQAAPVIRELASAGREIGLHGQTPDDAEGLAAELRELGEIAGRTIAGVRMHYLRLTRQVLDGLERAGGSYDSTVMDRTHLDPDIHPLQQPRRLRDRLVEVPLHVMDSTLFSVTGLALSLDEAIDYVRRVAERARALGRAVVVNLHPNYFSRQTPEVREWYRRLLGELTRRSDVHVTDLAGLLELLRDP